MAEIWKPIVGFEGYEVSDQGRVRSLDRTVLRRDGVYMRVHGRPKHFSMGGHGYYGVHLSGGGAGGMRLVHRLVAIAFLEPDSTRLFTNHKDGVKTNNVVGNLEWVTKSENAIHSFRVLGQRTSLPKKPVVIGGIRYGSFYEAATALDCSAGHIHSSLAKNHKLRGMEVTLG